MDSNTHEVLPATAGEMRPEAGEAKTTGAKLTAQQWAELEAAYHAGETAKQVGARFGVSAQRVYTHVGASGKLAQRRLARVTDGDSTGARMLTAIQGMSEVLARVGRAMEMLGRELMKVAGIADNTRLTRDGRNDSRTYLADEIWAAAKRDYVDGDFTAPAIAERYNVPLKTVETRASREGCARS